ncbi:hypothetical protein [Paenibacillus hemerocallicola]|nr:hypothetical protein [Paenibacillus hemerocallicola]
MWDRDWERERLWVRVRLIGIGRLSALPGQDVLHDGPVRWTWWLAAPAD